MNNGQGVSNGKVWLATHSHRRMEPTVYASLHAGMVDIDRQIMAGEWDSELRSGTSLRKNPPSIQELRRGCQWRPVPPGVDGPWEAAYLSDCNHPRFILTPVFPITEEDLPA